jgi:poly(3-hydroxybutyrate) depolymerase
MVDDFVAFAESLLVLDEDRIHAVGFSNGAMFTQHLATKEPNVFASVVSIAGTSGAFLEKFVSTCNDPYDPACNWNPLDTVFPPLGSPRPFVDIYLLRGDLDPLVPPTGGGSISALTLSTHVLPALTNPAAPGFSDYELWQFATACAILTTNVYANSTKYHCEGLGADVRHDIVYTMTHSPPTLTNASFNGPRKIAKFLWNHPK